MIYRHATSLQAGRK